MNSQLSLLDRIADMRSRIEAGKPDNPNTEGDFLKADRGEFADDDLYEDV